MHASGDRVRYGHLRPDVNRYLKWSFAKAANSVAVHQAHCPYRHLRQLYGQLRQRKGTLKYLELWHTHLAEAAFHVLRRQPAYQEPVLERGSTSGV